jgi:hypothetical protein
MKNCCCRSTPENATPTLMDVFRSELARRGCDTDILDNDCREPSGGSSSMAGKGGFSYGRAWEREWEERGALRSWLRHWAWSYGRATAGEIDRRNNCRRWPDLHWALFECFCSDFEEGRSRHAVVAAKAVV